MIKVSEIIREVKRLAAESPDNVYNPNGAGCSYTLGDNTNGSRGCIVGQALKALGVDLAALREGIIEVCLNRIPHESDVDNGILWLAGVQGCQDSRNPWGEAVLNNDNLGV